MDRLLELCTICEGMKLRTIDCGSCNGKGSYTPKTKSHPCRVCKQTGKIQTPCRRCRGVGYVLTEEGRIFERILDVNKESYY